MSEDPTLKLLTALAAKCVRLEARCDALGQTLCAVALQQGLPLERIASAIDRATARAHQKRLEAQEDLDPSTAAALDLREPGDDLGL